MLKSLLRWITPFGLVSRHRDQMSCLRLGLDPTKVQSLLPAATLVRYSIWPESLRKQSNPFVVDVGANRGQFTLAVLTLKPEASIVAIEPQADCCEDLRQATCTYERATVIESAIGDHNGTVIFNHVQDDVASSILFPDTDVQRHYHGTGMTVATQKSVPIQTLDQLIPQHQQVALLKIDVQGYEAHVLNGASSVLARTQCVLIEVNYRQHYKGEARFTALHLQLEAHGFTLHGISEPYFSQECPLWADALYVRAGL